MVVQGEPFRDLYVVVEGCLKLCESQPDGTDRIVGFRVPGEVIGFEALTLGWYPYRAEALGSVRVCRMKWRGVETAAHGRLLAHLLKNAARQLGTAESANCGATALERVQRFLADFAARTHAQATVTAAGLQLPMTRAELGSYLGLAEETVVRTLKRLRDWPVLPSRTGVLNA